MSSSGRAWGTAAEDPTPEDLLSATKTQREEQDERLERLGQAGTRILDQSRQINSELRDQNRLLDDIDEHVDRTDAVVRDATVMARQTEAKATKQKGLIWTIALLFVAIIVLIILASIF